MGQFAKLNQAGDVIEEIREFPNMNPDEVGRCDDGNLIWRPFVQDDPAQIPSWQMITAQNDVIEPDQVRRTWVTADKPLPDVQLAKLADLEVAMNAQQVIGFEFEGQFYPLTDQGQQRMATIANLPPVQQLTVPNTSWVSQLVSDPVAWLESGNEALAALFQVHDSHAANIAATTTPQEAAEYDVATGWPHLPPAAGAAT